MNLIFRKFLLQISLFSFVIILIAAGFFSTVLKDYFHFIMRMFSKPHCGLNNVIIKNPQHPEVMFTINAIVHPEIELSDSSIFFETAPAEKEIRKEIILTLPVDKAIKIISAKSNDPYVFATIAPFPNSDGKKVKLIAIRKAAMKPGDHYGDIIIKTDSKRTPTITIYEGGTVASGKGRHTFLGAS